MVLHNKVLCIFLRFMVVVGCGPEFLELFMGDKSIEEIVNVLTWISCLLLGLWVAIFMWSFM